MKKVRITDGMWSHDCRVERAPMMIGLGEECSWCGGTLHDETFTRIRFCTRCEQQVTQTIDGLCPKCHDEVPVIDPTLGVEAADVSTIDGYQVGNPHPNVESL